MMNFREYDVFAPDERIYNPWEPRFKEPSLLARTCPVPNCPVHPHQRPEPINPNCICNKPLWIAIPPGEHIHCPVHPNVIIHGPNITW